jgi:hypothetical protein
VVGPPPLLRRTMFGLLLVRPHHRPTATAGLASLSRKRGNDQYYKGTGANKAGRSNTKARFQPNSNSLKVIQFEAHWLKHFPLRPYVTRADADLVEKTKRRRAQIEAQKLLAYVSPSRLYSEPAGKSKHMTDRSVERLLLKQARQFREEEEGEEDEKKRRTRMR